MGGPAGAHPPIGADPKLRPLGSLRSAAVFLLTVLQVPIARLQGGPLGPQQAAPPLQSPRLWAPSRAPLRAAGCPRVPGQSGPLLIVLRTTTRQGESTNSRPARPKPLAVPWRRVRGYRQVQDPPQARTHARAQARARARADCWAGAQAQARARARVWARVSARMRAAVQLLGAALPTRSPQSESLAVQRSVAG